MLNVEGLKSLLAVGPGESSTTVLVFADQATPRLEYVCRFIFGTALNVKHKITINPKTVSQHEGPVINYSTDDGITGLQIRPDGLLSESFINSIEPVFESGSGKGEGVQFDLLSAVFFLISRYEEWQSFIPDQHNRFELQSSSLYRSGLHLQPVVDQWCQELRQDLQKAYPTVNWPSRQFKVLSTIDVDNLYAYKNKNTWRVFGGTLRDLLRADFAGIRERFSVRSGSKMDPFDIYEEVSAFCFEHRIPLIFFFLQKSGTEFDRTVDPASPAYSDVIRGIHANMAAVGLHPSYDSYADEAMMMDELRQLQQHNRGAVTFSRQHYLRFNIRVTPRLLMQCGIQADFSMGFASGAGFRAGTSLPFHYYDFEKEKEESLLFVPFCAMDGAYTTYSSRDTEQAYSELSTLASQIKKYGGIFTTVYHERSFSDHLYKGFGSLYKKLHAELLS